jgi:hypothetical protein
MTAVVPVVMGCCPTGSRCLLCAPPPEPPDAELVTALIEHYRPDSRSARAARAQDPRDPEVPLRVGFYGGPPPPDDLLDALDGLPFVARVRPDLLSRADLERLAQRGAVGIELDALSFDDSALIAVGRRYRAKRVLEQLEAIAVRGLRPGVVLAPGLPGTSHAGAVSDARIASTRVQFARLHPVLVLDGAGLHRAQLDGTYTPLELGEAVTTCRAMLDILQEAGVEVIRVGQNPVADGIGRALAGPRHPAFRQLCDARKTLAVLKAGLVGTPPGSRVAIRCNPADETSTRGPYNQHVRTLRAAYGLAELRVRPDPSVDRGSFVLIELDERGTPTTPERP